MSFQLTTNQLLYQQKRYRGKINLKKPKVFYKKQILNELLTPFFAKPVPKNLVDVCLNEVKNVKKGLGPYETIIAREVRNWFDNSKMIACIHVNSMCRNDIFDIEVPLRKENMYYKRYSPKIVREAIKNSSYESLEPLLSTYTAFVFSPDINVIALEKIIKKCRKMFTLGGVLLGEVMNYADLVKFGKMDETTMQLNLFQQLQTAGGVNLNRQLIHHQSTLVDRLKQIGKNETASNENE